MDRVNWSKTMAAEIIKAGYRALTKRYHPDAGGSHDEMVVLKATTDHLERLLTNPVPQSTFGSATRQPNWRPGWQRGPRQEPPPPRPKAKPRDKIPIEPYNEYGWYCVKDTIVLRITEKALQVQFPGYPLPQWLPKTQLHKTENKLWDETDRGTLVFSGWIARQKGWID